MTDFQKKLQSLSTKERKERKQWIEILDVIFDIADTTFGMTAQDLARKSKLSHATISRLWHGEFLFMRTTTISKLLDATELSLQVFCEAGISIPNTKKAA